MHKENVRDNLSIEYIAGLFDGEGNVNISNVTNLKGKTHFKSIRVAITGSYRPMIESIFQTTRLGSFSTQKRQVLHKAGKHLYTTSLSQVGSNKDIRLCKQCWRWLITSRYEAKIFLTKIYPYLIEKREQVRICLEFLDNKIEGDEAVKLCSEYKKFSFPIPPEGFETIRFNTHTLRGERNILSKLNNSQVTDIYSKYYKEKLRIREICKFYPDISESSINGIVHGKTWKHLTKDIII